MSRLNSIDGLPVIDAKRPLRISITKQDIAKAASNIKEPRGCAVARACYRELHAKEVRIHLSRAYVRMNDHNWVRYTVPTTLRAEIVSFDRGGEFSPCEAVLRAPSLTQQSGNYPSGRTKTGTGKKRGKKYVAKNVRAGPA